MKLEQLNPIATQIQSILGQQLISLGRNASGALINSLSHELIPKGEFGLDLKIMALNYWRVVEYGVPAANVPFDARTRSGANRVKSWWVWMRKSNGQREIGIC